MRKSKRKKLFMGMFAMILIVISLFMVNFVGSIALPAGAEREILNRQITVSLGPNENKAYSINVAPTKPYANILWVEYSLSNTAYAYEHDSGGLTMPMIYNGVEIDFVRSNHLSSSGIIYTNDNILYLTFRTNSGEPSAFISTDLNIDNVVFMPSNVETTTTIYDNSNDNQAPPTLFFIILAVIAILVIVASVLLVRRN